MSIVISFGGSFCLSDAVLAELVASAGYVWFSEDDLVAAASAASGLAEAKIRRVFGAKTSVFNKFTHEKECAVAYLRQALARRLAEEQGLIVEGCGGLLVPRAVTHALRVCLIADLAFRQSQAEASGLSPKEALRQIHRSDTDCTAWFQYISGKSDPWTPEAYDIVIPMHKNAPSKAASLIQENLLKPPLRPTEASRQAVSDFLLAANTEVAMTSAGHDVTVSADRGAVTLTINKQVLMLNRLSNELQKIAKHVPGVASVTTIVGTEFHQSHIYRRHNFEAPSRVLLVDDERDFVQTLSERLELRDMGSAVVFDGESALEIVEEDDPEVMIIDLKMPGITGLEVLRKVKAMRPEIEVIVLTGHGSTVDEAQCRELGAFAYLQKPVDIEHLSELLHQAHEKRRKNPPESS
jgi:two-component system, OmpR family, response regulator CpxR